MVELKLTLNQLFLVAEVLADRAGTADGPPRKLARAEINALKRASERSEAALDKALDSIDCAGDG